MGMRIWILTLAIFAGHTFADTNFTQQVVRPAGTGAAQGAPGSPGNPLPGQKPANPAAQPGQQTPNPLPPQMPNLMQPEVPKPIGNSGSNPYNLPMGSLQDAMRGREWREGGDDIPAADRNGNIIYGDGHRFRYGGVGAGNIGSGLCTAANANRTQAKAGFCRMLEKELNTEGTCAYEKLKQIIDRPKLGNSDFYCGNYESQDRDYKKRVIQKILEGLIVQESGWRPDAQERAWFKNGNPMGGKGLFQFGVRDNVKPGCGHINQSNILEAEANIKCGTCIALTNIAKDQTVGHGVGDDNSYGLARYFGPFRNAQFNKRQAIANSVKQWCASNEGATSGGGSGADPNANRSKVTN